MDGKERVCPTSGNRNAPQLLARTMTAAHRAKMAALFMFVARSKSVMICSTAHGRCAEQAVSQAFGVLFTPHSHSQSRLQPESTASLEFTKCRVANRAVNTSLEREREDETSLMLCGTNETHQNKSTRALTDITDLRCRTASSALLKSSKNHNFLHKANFASATPDHFK